MPTRYEKLPPEGRQAFDELQRWLFKLIYKGQDELGRRLNMDVWRLGIPRECGSLMCMGGFLECQLVGEDAPSLPKKELYERLGLSEVEARALFFPHERINYAGAPSLSRLTAEDCLQTVQRFLTDGVIRWNPDKCDFPVYSDKAVPGGVWHD